MALSYLHDGAYMALILMWLIYGYVSSEHEIRGSFHLKNFHRMVVTKDIKQEVGNDCVVRAIICEVQKRPINIEEVVF